MARSLVLAEIVKNGVTNPSAKSVMLLSGKIVDLSQGTMTYNGSVINCATIKYMVGDGSAPYQFVVTQAVSDIRASVNTANTSNNIEVVALTKINTDGTTQSLTVNISELVYAYAYPTSTFDSLVGIEDVTKTAVNAIRADQGVGSLVASLNA
jgi:hypothetical protein